MTWEEFRSMALEKGFTEAYSVSAEPFLRWREIRENSSDPRWARLHADPREILPQANAIAVLVWTYRPYSGFPSGSASIDAYYPASQTAYLAARSLADALRLQGYAADDSQAFSAKWSLMRTGGAFYGRNGLTSLGRYGTRICIQTILTDAPFPAIDHTPANELDPRCEHCGACQRACPTEAHDGTGRVSVERCLRAQPYADAVPERFRSLFGASLLGCDICQRACPRNREVLTADPPEGLVDALRLERLLAGDVKQLADWIGKNYARPARVQGRAALLAANLGRTDLLPLLDDLRGSHPMEYVREHARWAAERLREGKAW